MLLAMKGASFPDLRDAGRVTKLPRKLPGPRRSKRRGGRRKRTEQAKVGSPL